MSESSIPGPHRGPREIWENVSFYLVAFVPFPTETRSISCELMGEYFAAGTHFSKVNEVLRPALKGDPGRDTMGVCQRPQQAWLPHGHWRSQSW